MANPNCSPPCRSLDRAAPGVPDPASPSSPCCDGLDGADPVKTQFGALQYPPEWIPSNVTFESTGPAVAGNEVGREFLGYMFTPGGVVRITVLGVAVAGPAAYAFSRFRFPGRNLLFYGCCCATCPRVCS